LDGGTAISISSAFSFSTSTPEPEPADGFEFGVTLNYGADQDSVRLPRKFGKVVEVRTN
jgi:hypothetical protein